MDAGLERRIRQAMADRESRALHEQAITSSNMAALHEARDHILAEVPLAYGRLIDAVAEINDEIDGQGLRLQLAPISEAETIEASFVVAIWPEDAAGHGLIFNVTHAGQLIALLSTSQSRFRMKAADISRADRAFFMDALVSLIEASG